VVGTPQQRKRAANLLDKETKRIQGMVGRNVVLKYTPVLKFIIDEAIERGNRVLEILEEIEKQSPSTDRVNPAKPVPNEGSSSGR
jgi:ribosome-binding factor A